MPRPNKFWFRKSTGWWIVTIDGKWHKLAKGRNNKDAASKRFHELMLERTANPPVDGGHPTVASLIDAYLESIEGGTAVGQRTYDDKFRYLQDFAEHHGLLLARDLKPYHADMWLKSHKGWSSPETKSDAVKHVKRVFNWAVDSGLLSASPVARLRVRFGMQTRRAMTNAEAKGFLRALAVKKPKKVRAQQARQRLRDIFVFLMLTGARPSEARALRWTDVDLKKGLAILKEHKTVKSQTKPRPRVIVLAPAVIKLVERIQSRAEHGEFIFVNGCRRPWTKVSMNQAFRRIRDEASLPDELTPYTLRHRFGTQASVRQVELATISQLMGHTSTRTTERYVHLDAETAHLRESMLRAIGGHRDA